MCAQSSLLVLITSLDSSCAFTTIKCSLALVNPVILSALSVRFSEYRMPSRYTEYEVAFATGVHTTVMLVSVCESLDTISSAFSIVFSSETPVVMSEVSAAITSVGNDDSKILVAITERINSFFFAIDDIILPYYRIPRWIITLFFVNVKIFVKYDERK